MDDEDFKESSYQNQPGKSSLNDNLSDDLNDILKKRHQNKQNVNDRSDIYNVCDDVTKDLDKLNRDINSIMVRDTEDAMGLSHRKFKRNNIRGDDSSHGSI